MASDFLYVLVAGIAILVIGGVLAGFAEDTGVGRGGERPIFSGSVGALGEIESSPRTISFGDMKVEKSSLNRTVEERAAVSVGSDVFGSTAEVLEFEASKPERVYISFVPSLSASPDNLVVEINGEKLEVPEYEAGERVTLSSEEVRRGNNIVRVAARRPGLAFWSSPSYRLSNFRIVLADRAHSQVVRPFRVYPYEIDGFDRGVLRFSITEDVVTTRPMEISINGDTVVKRTFLKSALPYTETFFSNTTGITAGENVLSFSTSGSAVYRLDDVRMEIHSVAGTRKVTVVREFELSRSEHSALSESNGKLVVDVERVVLARPVTVEIGNTTFTRTLNAGRNTFRFGKDDVSAGTNTLRLSTDGSYRISNLTVSIVD